ncbi:hypothetical protein KIN20_003422 [Parelaphostrongylus tenuis]|uniref:Uncharacterized protein n=1 Tax=Parelaphostrongylus tenuis TaxID=148309 RepID=A0AAD5QEC0_PARTN|nr:hypothetical protein KIN20_003422 [Parelaphostrongylus tenuis]
MGQATASVPKHNRFGQKVKICVLWNNGKDVHSELIPKGNPASLLSSLIVTTLLATISTVLGCGVMPAGQGIKQDIEVTEPSPLTGFTLPVAMAYSSAADVQARVPGISPSEMAAQTFVNRLVMQTVFDVIECQARSALLPDAVISMILGQLTVQVNYTPINCQNDC